MEAAAEAEVEVDAEIGMRIALDAAESSWARLSAEGLVTIVGCEGSVGTIMPEPLLERWVSSTVKDSKGRLGALVQSML